MTLLPEVLAKQVNSTVSEPVMAIVDEYGKETPITELDIRRSLKQLDEAHHESRSEMTFEQLMSKVFAARAIA